MLLSITEFIGRFHPVFVHLPIGILLLALLLQWFSRKESYTVSPAVLKLIWSLGVITALVSCITGYLLSLRGEYEGATVALHMWCGIGVAIVALLLAARVFRQQFDWVYRTSCFALLALITVTGHLGGTLTHGDGYLIAALSESGKKEKTIKPLANAQEALVYADVVQPLLETRCYSCHGEKKQKGRLRMDQPQALLKGGKNGPVILKGKGEESELIKRLLLPQEDEDHMPPKQKPQLTRAQIALLHWWIDKGAPFDKKLKELEQPETVRNYLAGLQNPAPDAEKNTTVVDPPVDAADPKALEALRKKGVIVIAVAQNSNYVAASFVTAAGFADKDMELLLPLSKQLVSLNLANTAITDAAMPVMAKLGNLRRLHLTNTAITDNGLTELKKNSRLQYLNLVGTKVGLRGVSALKDLQELKCIYLFHSNIKTTDWPILKKIFPKAALDSGGYTVPTLASDTIKVQPPAKKE